MGYDFLGTMGTSQWEALKNFTANSLKEAAPNSPQLRYMLAEVIRAEKTLADLEKACAQNYNSFMGDIPYEESVQKSNKTFRYNLSDGETAIYVQDMKMFQKQNLKRKKDNLEYRIKKFRDLVDQLAGKAALFLNAPDFVTQMLSQVEIQFTDTRHKHNLRQGDIYDAQGNIMHTPSVSLVTEEGPKV